MTDKFKNLFTKFGLILNNGQETANILNVDQRIFQTNLKNYLSKNKNEMQEFKTFLTNEYFEDDVNFIVALLPTNNDPNMVVSHSSNQDNLVKLLIEVELLQSDLFDYLIDKATNLSLMSDVDVSSTETIMNVNKNDIPTFIINQFRYQPKINEPQVLCEKLLTMVTSITSVALKIDIISCFSDILSDSVHDDIALKLSEFLVENELSSSILETLSNLKLNEKTNVQIVEKLFEIYGVMSENDLHSVVKFILKSSNVLNSSEILNKLLSKLVFGDIDKEDNRLLIYHVLKEYFQISNHLIELFVSIISKNLTESNENEDEIDDSLISIRKFQSIDFIIVSIIYSFPQQYKQIDKLFKQLIRENSTVAHNIEKSIVNTLKLGNIILKELFESIFLIAKSLIQSPFNSISSIGKCVYKNGFEFYEKKFKQKIVNILVDLITCSSDFSRDNSLDILEDLCTKNINNVVAYSMEIKTLLDFIEYFNLNQIRKLYFIVCSIAYSSNDDSIKSNNNIQDNLHILINKQLASNVLKYKQIGVIGALMMIKCMSSRSNSNTNEIKHIWQMIMDSSKSSPESLGLFQDDLTSLLKKESIPANVESLIKENLKEITSSIFKLDVNYESKLRFFNDKLSQFKIGHEFGLDDSTSGCLNLITQLMNDFLKKNSSLILNKTDINNKYNLPTITIASTFRLISALERKNAQIELKDYLGLPILTIKKDDLYKYGNLLNDENNSASYYMKFRNILNDDEKKILCDTVFYLINWFIELVNSFSSMINPNEEQDEMCKKLLDRLNSLYQLQEILKYILPFMKYYRPPMAIFGLIDMSIEELPYVHNLIKLKDLTKSSKKPKAASKRKKQDKKVTKKSKKSKNNSEIDDDDKENLIEDDYIDEKELVSDSDDDINVGLDSEDVSTQIDLSKLSIYFRELDLCVINFLNFKLDMNSTRIIPDSGKLNMSSLNTDSQLAIAPHLLCFVLNDFNKKLPLVLKSDSSAKKEGGLGFGGGGGLLAASSAGQSIKPSKMNTFLQLNTIDAKHLVKLIMNNCFNSLCDHLDDIYRHVKQIQSKNDGLKDPPELYTNINNLNILHCLNQLLKTIYNLFLWLGNSSNTPENKEICVEMIKQIGSKLVVTTNASTQVEKSPETFCLRYLFDLREVVVDLETGDLLIKIMNLLTNKIFPKYGGARMNDPKKYSKIIYTACKQFLYDDYNAKLALYSTRQVNNEAIVNMLNVLLESNEFDKSLKVASSLFEIINGEEYMENRQNCSDINTLKNHFLQYFKVLVEFSVNGLKFVSKYDIKKLSTDFEIIKQIVENIKTLTTMHCGLINLKKIISYKEINILTLLKNSKLFINNFLKYTMPWLDQAFEHMKEDVVNLLQELQSTIQYLQKVCQTSQNTAVTKQTPVYMRLVETFSLRVRQLLYVNRCDDAFIVNLFQNKMIKKNANVKSKKMSAKSVKGKKEVEEEDETTNDQDNDDVQDDEDNQDIEDNDSDA